MQKKELKPTNIYKLSPTECRIKQKSYTVFPTETFRLIKDPVAAIIWTFFMSHPPEWVVNKIYVRKNYGFGERRTDDAFRYLQEIGLARTRAIKCESGRFNKHIWEIYSEPTFE